MNNKIPLRTLAESMAAKAGVSPAEAQNFIKESFRQVVEALYAGEEVEIDSFGKFTTVTNLTDPVRFSPCEELVDEMNAPFALFSPIEIHDTDSIESIMAMKDEENAVEPETTETQTETAEEVASEPIAENEPIVEVYSEPEIPVVQEYEVTVSEIEVVEEPVAAEPVEIEKVTPPTEDENVAPALPEIPVEESAESVPEIPVAEEAVEEVPEKVTEEGSEDVAVPELPQIEEPAEPQENQVEPEVSANKTALYSEPTIIPESEEQRTEYYVRKSSRFGIGFILGLIVGLLLGTIALACYAIYFVNTGLSLF